MSSVIGDYWAEEKKTAEMHSESNKSPLCRRYSFILTRTADEHRWLKWNAFSDRFKIERDKNGLLAILATNQNRSNIHVFESPQSVAMFVVSFNEMRIYSPEEIC